MRHADAVRVRRSMLGPIRPPPTKRQDRGILDRPIPRKIFESVRVAVDWAQKHADENCHFHQRWEVESIGTMFAVGVYSQNSGEFSHWAD